MSTQPFPLFKNASFYFLILILLLSIVCSLVWIQDYFKQKFNHISSATPLFILLKNESSQINKDQFIFKLKQEALINKETIRILDSAKTIQSFQKVGIKKEDLHLFGDFLFPESIECTFNNDKEVNMQEFINRIKENPAVAEIYLGLSFVDQEIKKTEHFFQLSFFVSLLMILPSLWVFYSFLQFSWQQSSKQINFLHYRGIPESYFFRSFMLRSAFFNVAALVLSLLFSYLLLNIILTGFQLSDLFYPNSEAILSLIVIFVLYILTAIVISYIFFNHKWQRLA